MKRYANLVLLLLVFGTSMFAQSDPVAGKTVTTTPVSAKKDDPANGLAKLALVAHGGEKLKHLKTLLVRGSVDVTSSMFNQALPATFVSVMAGDRYLFELKNPMQPLKQIYDGRQTFSSITGYALPPITSVGVPVLSRIGDSGYLITALPEGKKKKAGFRITTPEGYYTDFFVDEKTNQVKGYESSYEVSGRMVTTSVEIDKYQTVDGILIPDKYSQRFDLGTMTAWANFKSKQILVNSEIADDVFAMPK